MRIDEGNWQGRSHRDETAKSTESPERMKANARLAKAQGRVNRGGHERGRDDGADVELGEHERTYGGAGETAPRAQIEAIQSRFGCSTALYRRSGYVDARPTRRISRSSSS